MPFPPHPSLFVLLWSSDECASDLSHVHGHNCNNCTRLNWEQLNTCSTGLDSIKALLFLAVEQKIMARPKYCGKVIALLILSFVTNLCADEERRPYVPFMYHKTNLHYLHTGNVLKRICYGMRSMCGEKILNIQQPWVAKDMHDGAGLGEKKVVGCQRWHVKYSITPRCFGNGVRLVSHRAVFTSSLTAAELR